MKKYVFASEGFTICTHTTSLTFDLSHWINKNSPNIKKINFQGGKKVKNPSEEQQRRIRLQDGQKNRCHVTRINRVTELHKNILSPTPDPNV